MQTSLSYVQSPIICSRTSLNTRSVWTSLQGAPNSSWPIVRPNASNPLLTSRRENVTAVATAARCPSTVVCLAFPNSASNTANAPGPGLSRNETVPYRWSWQDDMEHAAALELDPTALAAASTLPELTAFLQTAITTAPPRAILSTAARRLLNAAVQRILISHERASASSTSPSISVGDVARLLEAYGAASSQAAHSPANYAASASHSTSGDSADLNSSVSPLPLLTSLLAHLCTPNLHLSSQRTTPVEAASAQELAELLWAISEIQEDLPWDACATTLLSSPAHRGTSSYDRPVENAADATVSASAEDQLEPESITAAGSTAISTTASTIAAEATVIAATEVPMALQRAVAARLRDQDFLAPDLCRVVSALGSLSASGGLTSAGLAPPSAGASAGGEDVTPAGSLTVGFGLHSDVVRSLEEEIRYQLTEFDADFEAVDLGRLISGMAGLRLGAAVAGDAEFRRVLMKAVYGKTRSLTDKAAVDFALSRLLDDDPEARSMHYDSRWTHEELRWLPRRERDKRRIIKEGWYRTKWGGWSPGGEAE